LKLSDLSIHAWIQEHKIKNEKGDPIDFYDHFFLFDIYRDQSQNLCVMKPAQVGLSTLEVIKNLYDAKKYKMDIIYCVDTETEALTKRGFLPYSEITTSDELLTLDLQGVTHWNPVQEIFTNDVETTMYEYKARNFNALSTYNHRWIVKGKGNKYEIQTSEELGKTYRYIPKSVNAATIYPQPTLQDDYVRLLAWVFAEGNYPRQTKGSGKNCYSVIITQSHIKNPIHCEELRRIFTSLNITWKEYVTQRGDCTNFRIAFTLGRKIRTDFPNKIPTMDLALLFTRDQAQIFIKTFVHGDGWIDKSGTLAITQKSKETVDILCAIAVIAGYAPSVVSPSTSGCYTLRLTQMKMIHTGELHPIIHPNWKGKIWCPRTSVGTFYARRKGRMYWTGNTLPTDNDVNIFVGGKVNRIIAQNPILLDYTKDKDSVEQKQVDDSMIYFRGTWTKKAAIMVAADRVVNDEKDSSKQDVVKDYEARLQHSKFKQKHVFSHPSVLGNGVDVEWQDSDQKHWFITCNSCLKEQYLSWNTEDPIQMSIDIEKQAFVCKHCGAELSDMERRKGKWKAKIFRDDEGNVIKKDYSGYWISLLMAPWVSAKEIVKKYKDPNVSEEFFYNKILGLPYVGSGNKVLKDMLDRNLTNETINYNTRTIIGVDTGLGIHVVAGNQSGLFYYHSSKNYDEFERLMGMFPDAIAVFDANGDLQKPRELAEKYQGRIFFCYYREDRKTKQLVTWGKKSEEGTVVVDRNKMIQFIVDEFTTKRIALFGPEADWYNYWLHWNAIFRVEETNSLGVKVKRWERSGADHLVHATVYWRTGMSRFGQGKGEIFSGETLDFKESPELNPDHTMTAVNPKRIFKFDLPINNASDWRSTQ